MRATLSKTLDPTPIKKKKKEMSLLRNAHAHVSQQRTCDEVKTPLGLRL